MGIRSDSPSMKTLREAVLQNRMPNSEGKVSNRRPGLTAERRCEEQRELVTNL